MLTERERRKGFVLPTSSVLFIVSSNAHTLNFLIPVTDYITQRQLYDIFATGFQVLTLNVNGGRCQM